MTTPFSGNPIAADPEVAHILADELERQRTTIQLIASENFTSPAVMAATASVLTNKYSEGYPGRRYYGGNVFADEIEDLARSRVLALFGGEHANVQPHSGSSANLAAYLALVDPGETILAMRLDQGGHLTHGSPVSITGKMYRFVSYGVTPAGDDESGERIDFDEVRDLARRERPKMIVAGTTAYTRIIDPAPFREIADEIGAYFLFDAAHPAGLIAGGVHPSPVGIADVVTFTTHKTLRGPRGGAVISTAEVGKKIDGAVFPGLQGGPLDHVVAAKAVAFAEAMTPEFKQYAADVVENAAALAASLRAEGFRLVAGGTDNHQVILDMRTFDDELTGKAAQDALDRAGITCNRNTIPNDPRSAFVTSGLRLGSAAETTDEMAAIGRAIGRILRSPSDESVIASVRAEVRELCAEFDPYPEV